VCWNKKTRGRIRLRQSAKVNGNALNITIMVALLLRESQRLALA
jgi:hypothetical protein